MTRRIWSLMVLVAACVTPAWAAKPGAGEEAGGPDEDREKSDLVEYVEVDSTALPDSNSVATKLPTSLSRTPFNVGVVGHALIEEQDADVLGDALRNVSGVNIQAGPAVHDFFAIRGFESLSGGVVMTDGASELDASFYPMYNVQGVEVLKGAGGFVYGGFPIGGTVNLVREQPLPGDFLVVGGSLGSWGRREATVDWNLADASARRAVRVNALWRDEDRYRDTGDAKYSAVNPAFTWRFGETSSLNLNLEIADVEYAPDSGTPLLGGRIPNVPRDRSYQSPIDFSEQDIVRFQADWERAITDRFTLRTKTYYRRLDWQSTGTLFNGTAPTPGGPFVFRTLTILDDDRELAGNQLEGVWELGSRVEHRILVGVEVSRLTDEFTLDILPPDTGLGGMPAISLFNPVETFTSIPFTVPLGSGDITRDVVAPYVLDQMRFSEKLELLVGGRWDRIDFEDDVSGINRDDSDLSPMAGVVFSPRRDLSFYANAGESFSPQSPRVQGNPGPEETAQVEVGVRKSFDDGRYRVTLAAYDIDREDVPITDATGFLQDAGDQSSRGAEVEIAAQPADSLRVLFSYAWNDSELDRFSKVDPGAGGLVDLSGKTPPYAPEHLANLWVSRSFRSGLAVGAGARYIGEQYFTADNAFEIDDALVWNGSVSYDFDAWRFRLHLKNLTDEEYETGSFGSDSVVPADPFSVEGGVEYRF